MKLKKKDDTEDDTPDTDVIILDKPPADLVDSQDQIEEVEARFQRRTVELKNDQRQALESFIDRVLGDWEENSTTLFNKLRDWNDLYEGVTTISDYPWVGASSLHIPLPKIKAREIRSTINRSTMRPIPFLQTKYAGPDALYEDNKDLVGEYEDFLEDKIKNDTNVHKTLVNSLIPIIRDGTVPIQITWETEIETVSDYKSYTSVETFTTDYPTPGEAGLTNARYKEIVRKIADGKPHEIQYEYDLVTYDGPKAYIVPLIDFVHWPIFVPDVSDTLVHGKRVWFTDYQLEDMVRIGKFKDKVAITELVASGGETHDKENLTQSRDQIEGINRNAAGDESKEFEFFELCVKTSLTEEDKKKNVKRKYQVLFHRKKKKIHFIQHWPIRKGKSNYFILRLVERDNRLMGMSLIDDMSDLSLEIDIIHRQRINSRTISHVPSFKAKSTAKGMFDPSDKRYRFAPGVTFWLTNMDDVEQFDVKPVDLSGSVEDEMLLFQLIDMVTGSSSGNSGQANPLDPRAPARKQQELLRQSSNRIDDYVEALLPTFSDIGSFVFDQYYQNAPDRIKYYVTKGDGGKVQKEMDRSKLYNPNVMFVVQGTSVFTSPQQEFQQAMEIESIVAQNPITQQNQRVRRNSLGRIYAAGRVQNNKDLLPTDEEIGIQTDPATGIIKSPDDKAAEQKAALQEQKLATKVAGEQARQQHQADIVEQQGQQQAALQQHQAILDQQAQADQQAHELALMQAQGGQIAP